MLKLQSTWFVLLWGAFAMTDVEGSAPVKAVREKAPKYRFSICAIFKNESGYLKEWIEYHRLIGVDHFYLYNCASRDSSQKELRPYVQKGIVTLVNWPDPCEGRQNCDFLYALTTQIPAYENAVALRAAKETNWLVFLNVDEFLVPMPGNRLSDVLEKYRDFPAISLTSEWYEADNAGRDPTRKLVIETVELVADPHENIQKQVVKMIVKPSEYKGFQWAPYRCTFDDQKPVAANRHELRVNRYLNRYKGFLDHRKKQEKLQIDNRGLSEGEKNQLLEMGYTIEDQEKAIYQFVPELLNRMNP